MSELGNIEILLKDFKDSNIVGIKKPKGRKPRRPIKKPRIT